MSDPEGGFRKVTDFVPKEYLDKANASYNALDDHYQIVMKENERLMKKVNELYAEQYGSADWADMRITPLENTINQLLVDKLELVIMLQEFIEAMQSKRSLIDTIEKAQKLIEKHSPK